MIYITNLGGRDAKKGKTQRSLFPDETELELFVNDDRLSLHMLFWLCCKSLNLPGLTERY